MNKPLYLVTLCAIGLGTLNTASALELKAGAGSWSAEIDGTVQDQDFFGGTGTEIDFEDTLGFNKSSQSIFYAQLEHPIPFIPNIRLAHTELEFNEINTLSQALQLDNQTFNTAVESTFDLTHTDATLYYQFLDSTAGIIDLDLGLTARIFSDGKLTIENAVTGSAEADVSGVLPMLYTDVVVHIPTTGLYAGIQANLLNVGGDGLYDVSIRGGWQSPWLVGVEVVHRNISLDYESSDDIEIDFDISGTFANLFITF